MQVDRELLAAAAQQAGERGARPSLTGIAFDSTGNALSAPRRRKRADRRVRSAPDSFVAAAALRAALPLVRPSAWAERESSESIRRAGGWTRAGAVPPTPGASPRQATAAGSGRRADTRRQA